MSSRSSDPDSDLLPGLQTGQERALRILIERRMVSVHRLAYRLLGDTFEAEDVCQETFLKFWRVVPTWRTGEARILTWLCRVATNDCYDRLRRKRPDLAGDGTHNGATEIDAYPDDRCGVDAAMIDRERWDALQAAMMSLPERQRVALALCYDQGLSQREAARVMEIGEKAYEALLVRGRKALRTLMEARENA